MRRNVGKGGSRKGSKDMPTASAKAPMGEPVSLEDKTQKFVFVNPPKKHLWELTGNDIPPGIDPDDLTIECEDQG